MKWNINFEVMSLITQYILYWYYKRSSRLHLVRHNVYMQLLVISMIASVLNVVSAEVEYLMGAKCIWLLYILNGAYFIFYEMAIFSIFMYGMTYLGYYSYLKRHLLVYSLPILSVVLTILSSPITHAIFSISSGGVYSRSTYYFFINVPIYIYAVVLMVCMSKCTIKHPVRNNVCMLVAYALVVIGTGANYVSSKSLLMAPFITFALMIVYLTFESPHFYISVGTQAYNAHGFDALIDQYKELGEKYYCCGFFSKNINTYRSYYGYNTTDRGLKSVASWVRHEFSDSNVFYLGEGVFVLTNTKPFDEELFRDTILNRFVSKFNDEKGRSLYFTSTVFVVDDTQSFEDASDIVAGINYVRREEVDRSEDGIYHIDLSVSKTLKSDIEMLALIERRVLSGDVEVYFQPIISSKTKKVVGAEALCRLFDDDNNVVSPGIFIPLAERSGLIERLGMAVFDRVCQYVVSHDLDAMGIKFINVNISPVQYQDRNLVDSFKAIADSYNVDFGLFDFEITETVDDSSIMIDTQLPRFKDLGASISLDDFGSGSSNLTRLISYPIDVAKLDMGLVWNYFEGRDRIMESVITMFKNENLKIVAEGVETHAMGIKLSSMGCDYLQGFYFSKPLPMDEFDEYVEKNK